MNVSASDDSSDDYANISVVGCGSCCLYAAASSSFFAVSTRERVFKYDKTAADISDIVYELLSAVRERKTTRKVNTPDSTQILCRSGLLFKSSLQSAPSSRKHRVL